MFGGISTLTLFAGMTCVGLISLVRGSMDRGMMDKGMLDKGMCGTNVPRVVRLAAWIELGFEPASEPGERAVSRGSPVVESSL